MLKRGKPEAKNEGGNKNLKREEGGRKKENMDMKPRQLATLRWFMVRTYQKGGGYRGDGVRGEPKKRGERPTEKKKNKGRFG